MQRRRFLKMAGLAALATPAVAAAPVMRSVSDPSPVSVLKPARLAPGSTVGLVSPAGALPDRFNLDLVRRRLDGLGLRVKVAPHALQRRGYLAGADDERAADLHALFADREVDAIVALRGGWGCGRLLPLLDFDLIRRNPKIVLGYSDITSLLVALYARSGLVTFHGPVGSVRWSDFTVEAFQRVLFEGQKARVDPSIETNAAAALRSTVRTITPGRAEGTLVGGNLAVLAGLLGSDYVPDWKGHILFLEDTNEEVYRIDRMLTQLSLAGVLGQLAGFVFGKCTNCSADPSRSLTLDEVLNDHIRPLGIPAWTGAMIGHIDEHYTLPVGVRAAIDTERGTIETLEPAVV